MIPTPPTITVAWSTCHHLLSEGIPLSTFFATLADRDELETGLALLALTDPAQRQRLGRIALVLPQDLVTGPGADVIIGAFTHPTTDPRGSRFADTTSGTFYTARSLETAAREIAHHREDFLTSAHMPAMDLHLRDYTVDVHGDLADILTNPTPYTLAYDRNDYAHSQALARQLRAAGGYGIIYRSVRHAGGECAAAFRPPVLSNCTPGERVTLTWDGSRITGAETRVPIF